MRARGRHLHGALDMGLSTHVAEVGIVDGVPAEQPGQVDPGRLHLPLSVQELHHLGEALHSEDLDVLDHRRFRAVGTGQDQTLEPLRPDRRGDGSAPRTGLTAPSRDSSPTSM